MRLGSGSTKPKPMGSPGHEAYASAHVAHLRDPAHRNTHRGLAVFAFTTAAFAILAFLKQSKEVSHQAEMLEVQSGQLEEQRRSTRSRRRTCRRR